MPALSVRLSAISDFVTKGACVCDVGTDHGYLAIHLMKSGIANRVIATDIGEKPLKNALKNIENSGVADIELRLCDGLSGIEKNEADTVVIAGMGGEVISGILKRGSDIAKNENVTLILQPTTSPEYLRSFLYKEGYEISEETPIFENGKLYSVMKVNYCGNPTVKQEWFYYVGKVTPLTDAGLKYIKKQQNRCFKCMESLENIPEKQDEYLQYKTAFWGLESYLKNFDGEELNGI